MVWICVSLRSAWSTVKVRSVSYTHLMAMSPSVKKTYTRAWLDAKTDAGREKRLAWMVERLNKNLKPM